MDQMQSKPDEDENKGLNFAEFMDNMKTKITTEVVVEEKKEEGLNFAVFMDNMNSKITENVNQRPNFGEFMDNMDSKV